MHMCRPILNFETKCVEFEIFNHVNFTNSVFWRHFFYLTYTFVTIAQNFHLWGMTGLFDKYQNVWSRSFTEADDHKFIENKIMTRRKLRIRIPLQHFFLGRTRGGGWMIYKLTYTCRLTLFSKGRGGGGMPIWSYIWLTIVTYPRDFSLKTSIYPLSAFLSRTRVAIKIFGW